MHHRHRPTSSSIRIMAIVWFFLLCVPSTVTAADTHNAFVTATDIVNIRICPATDCEIVATARLGAPLDVIGNPVNGFLPVSFNGTRGFAYALYITDQVEDTWFTEGEAGCKRVAFIFNIGVGATPSQSVLDTLRARKVPATMFAMGDWAGNHPDFLRQLDRDGFTIGTHGNAATYLTTASNADIAADILASLDSISAVTGNPVAPWATPYAADTDPRVRRITAELGLVPVGWTVSAADYDAAATADSVYDRVIGGVTDGGIVEFHLDGPATESSTAVALLRIIETLRADGYTFVTVPGMATPCGSAL